MKLTSYLYTGPLSSASLRTEGEPLDVRLIPGKPVELPAEHEYTLVLLHLKQLTPIVAETTEAEPELGPESTPAKVTKKPTATTDGGAAQ